MKFFLYYYFLTTVTLALSEDIPVEEFSTGNQLFTQDVYNQLLLDNNDNILVSPFSAETLFALIQSGAKDATAEEIRTTFHLVDSEEEIEREFKNVLPTIRSDYVTLVTANKIYVENNFPLKENFKKVASDVYQASFQNIEFTQNEEAAEEINKWVEEETKNKIKDLVSPDDLDGTTKVVLVNALYFKGNWSLPFNTFYTSANKFFAGTGSTVDVQMMYQEIGFYNHYDSVDLDAQILEIPFEGGEATMTFVLPNQNEGIALLEKKMSAVLTKPKYAMKDVRVMLPKFKIESTLDVKALLRQLGINKLFSFEADLSGMAGYPGELYISQAKQKTYIDVNEGGIEAAAATEAGAVKSSAVAKPPSTYFIADHPFVFYIKFHDIILFEGRVVNPKY